MEVLETTTTDLEDEGLGVQERGMRSKTPRLQWGGQMDGVMGLPAKRMQKK